ncbi:ABC transporter ATP-binding protein [Myxacorys almedinensis]|uniref:ATP-binding cassette domain-containing protein n=1 Tax=Myxacorys almedinensis A TaxID=2690445 RepID=A0A8J7YZT1_9CYAN|nr:ABC transporter ATP-binding protein [Myxacorys almedinensis]NDJ16405.1 ATP-binding cassette domain-containing protein [Myxacorys almedinensis A]
MLSDLYSSTQTPDLKVIDLAKQFGSLIALDRVSLHLQPGSFHALLGENGAGKSTLVKCIMGFYQPTSGEILIEGRSQEIKSPSVAHQFGIGMVYQHFTSVPAMTVAENLVLSRFDSPKLINWRQEMEQLQAFMEAAPFQIPLTRPVSQLAAGEKQKLEILKQLYLKSRVLILDEPTSVLTPGEADEILGLLRKEVTAGHLSVLMISHKFREVMAFADEVTVLRKGRLAGQGFVKELTIAAMAQMMLGEERTAKTVAKATLIAETPVLEIHNLCADKDNGLPAIATLNLSVHSGEIVGIAGVSGNGQKELVESLAGQRVPTAGQICVNGEPYTATRAQMFRHQVFVLPEEPLQNACVSHMSVSENLALRTFDRPPQSKQGFLLLRVMRQMAQTLVQTFSIRTPSVNTPVGNLSGGNVQRTVLARELSSDQIRLLIASNPCFGLDFAAVEYIHSEIVAARNRGVAVLLVSEDLDELLTLADRILVMSDGKLVYEGAIAEVDLTTIGRRMAGHSS